MKHVDMRNPIALARDEWMNSDEGRACSVGSANGVYLRNRLELAFIAGWTAAEKQQQSERAND